MAKTKQELEGEIKAAVAAAGSRGAVSSGARYRAGQAAKAIGPGDRVRWVSSGARFGQLGDVEHVRKDGLLVVRFDADAPGSVLVVNPLDVKKEALIAGSGGAMGGASTLRLRDKGRGHVVLTMRDGVVVGAMGSEPQRFMGLTEANARSLAAGRRVR